MRALTDVAQAVAATDPGRAARLADEAERIASSLTKEDAKAYALSDVAAAVALTDPDRAERIANAIATPYEKALALSGIAKTLVE